jgi:hypothetical protein
MWWLFGKTMRGTIDERDLGSGDRIRIRQDKRPIPDLVGRIGTIVEVFRVPRDSCLVRVDDAEI